MISITSKKINELSILEICDSEFLSVKRPLIVFYHSWTGCKETALPQGYELAKRGFRVILPDALYHGTRGEGDLKKHILEFWKIVLNSVEEFPQIVDYYQKTLGIKDDFIGVGGISMGGITTNALMTTYPKITAGVSLMGSPTPVKLAKRLADNVPQVKQMPTNAIEAEINQLRVIDLSLNLANLAQRPLHFWHGTADDFVPYQDVIDFYNDVKDTDYAKNITLSTTENVGHKVNHVVTLEMANKFREYYQDYVSDRGIG